MGRKLKATSIAALFVEDMVRLRHEAEEDAAMRQQKMWERLGDGVLEASRTPRP
jgi:hypothetical protein